MIPLNFHWALPFLLLTIPVVIVGTAYALNRIKQPLGWWFLGVAGVMIGTFVLHLELGGS